MYLQGYPPPPGYKEKTNHIDENATFIFHEIPTAQPDHIFLQSRYLPPVT